MTTRRTRRVLRRLGAAFHAEWYAFWRRRPVDQDTVLFESFAGHGAACNPEALFRAVHRAGDLAHMRSVWALDASSAAVVRAEFRGDRRVTVVRVGGLAYWRVLATAGTLVNNATFPTQFDRRSAQRYLNTWHGTPLKRMGYDEPDGARVSANVVRNFLQATWLLSQSRAMTNAMYRGSYRLGGIANATVLELGYPRNDRLFVTVTESAAIRNRLAAAGLDADGRIVLYAPTWRGARFSAPEDHSAAILSTARALATALRASGSSATVMVKPHQAVRAAAEDDPDLAAFLVPEDLPTNSLLAVTDVLVSDYSSIVVDFLVTGRPVVFAAVGDDDYERTRGLDVPVESFPGRRCRDHRSLAAEVVRAVQDGVDPEFADRYARMARTFVPDDDGRAAERVLDVVFRGRQPDPSHRDRLADPDRTPTETGTDPRQRPRILVHLGGMRANGITSAAVNLLPALVDAGVDVTAFAPASDSRAARESRARIDPRVRQVLRTGGMNGSKAVLARRWYADRTVVPEAHRRDVALARVWDEEWHRCLGDARFDAVVDFSGYSPFWATLLLHAPGPTTRSVWMHNDMSAEVHRLVGGRPRMRRSLRGVIGLYDQFDRVVAVSAALGEHNARSLAGLQPERCRSARNTIDDRAVRCAATAAPADALALDDVDDGGTPAWLADLDAPDTCWFVSVGRLSPEKNHARLLDAFATIRNERPADAPRLRLLVLGDGYLRADLERRAVRFGIADAVVFAGAVPNPHAFVARSDCLVLSSDHEGQPMVILEAAVLQRPIVSTRFASARDALPGGGVHLVTPSVQGVADGMRAFLAGQVPPARIDARAHNATAVREFLSATLPAGFLEPSGNHHATIDA